MAKRAASRYLSGARSKDWLKIKTGEASGSGHCRVHGAQAVTAALRGAGAGRARRDAWRYVGHVGTGFSHAMLEELHAKLVPLRTAGSPFKQRVKDEAATTWVKPKLVAEVKFTEWTSAGEMRHPAFLGLREDKKPSDVVLEKEEHRSK